VHFLTIFNIFEKRKTKKEKERKKRKRNFPLQPLSIEKENK
jgi:hypothetical protein